MTIILLCFMTYIPHKLKLTIMCNNMNHNYQCLRRTLPIDRKKYIFLIILTRMGNYCKPQYFFFHFETFKSFRFVVLYALLLFMTYHMILNTNNTTCSTYQPSVELGFGTVVRSVRVIRFVRLHVFSSVLWYQLRFLLRIYVRFVFIPICVVMVSRYIYVIYVLINKR